MKNKPKLVSGQLLLLASVVIVIRCSNAWAQSDRTFVATTGADTETCGSTSSPCRNFSQGIFRTIAGGEVIALDSGIYDPIPVTIAKAITLTAAPGVHAELFNNYVNPKRITVNAGTNDRVVLRNLYLTNSSSGDGYGIFVTSIGVLQIENCVVDGFGTGIEITLTSSAQVQISMKDTIVRNNTQIGAYFYTTAGTIKVSIDKSHFDNNVGSGAEFSGTGVFVGKRSKVTIRDSVATGNSASGFYAADDKADLNLENCESSNNRDGVIASDILSAGGGGTATVSNSIITNNSRYGFLQQGTALFNSMGNNTVRRNVTSNTNGTITVISGT